MNYNLGQSLFFVGDIHGQPTAIGNTILDNDFQNSDFVILGDVGLGFYGNHLGPLKALERIAAKGNNRFYIFRGNHDNPESFSEERKALAEKKFGHITFLRDFDTVTLAGGKKGLVVPGALSVDRNTCRYTVVDGKAVPVPRERGKQYWSDELMDYDKMAAVTEHYDFVLAHGGPTPPSLPDTGFIARMEQNDPLLREDMEKEQLAVHSLIERVKPDFWINGHYHHSEVFNVGTTTVVAVDQDAVAVPPNALS